MNKQLIGWFSLLVIVVAGSGIGFVNRLGIDPSIAGVLALGILIVAGIVIREARRRYSGDAS